MGMGGCISTAATCVDPATEATPAEPQEVFRLDYKAPEYYVEKIDLDVRIFEGETFVHSKLTVFRNPTVAHGTDFFFNGEDITYVSSKVNGVAITPESGKITVPAAGNATISGSVFPVDAEERFTIEFENKIVPETNFKLTGLYKSSLMYATQCEAEGFRRITYFPDRPDVMSSYTCRIEASKETCPVLLGNGDLTEQGDLENGRHYAVFVDPWKKPCYLFALVAGQLAAIHGDFITMSGKEVKLAIYSEPSDSDKLQWALHSLKLAMKWDEEKYGREYDLGIFNIVAVGDFNMGAMENKSLNIFNTALVLASPFTATDRDYLRVLGVVGHEYFHNWTGNRVTCRSWFELTLKEGLTVFRDHGFSSDQGAAAAKRIEDVSIVRSAQFAEDAGPMSHPIRPDSFVSIENFYTVTVYEKGSEIIKLYHTLFGEQGYRKGTDLYFDRHDGQAVTCDDFLNALFDANEVADVNSAFRQRYPEVTKEKFSRWYSTPGTPIVTVTRAEKVGGKYILTVTQTPSQSAIKAGKTEPLVIPIDIGIISLKTTEEIASTVLAFTEAEQTFEIPIRDVDEKVIPSLFRGFSAPVRVVFPQQTQEDRLALVANDRDAVNAWDAGQKVASDLIYQAYTKIVTLNENGEIDGLAALKAVPKAAELAATFITPGVLAAYKKLVTDETVDETLAALNLTFIDTKSLIGNYAADAAKNKNGIDPQAVNRARSAAVAALAYALYDEIKARYNALTEKAVAAEKETGYEVTPEAVGRRRLRNVLLALLSAAAHAEGVEAAKGEEARKLAVAQYKAATNLTDRLAAVGAVVDAFGTPERDELLEQLFKDANGDAQVEDKWFAIQASAEHSEIFSEANRLKEHPKFNPKNPNRLRSLVGSLAANTSAFHEASGAGYEYLADFVIDLNEYNSAVGARLAKALGEFKSYPQAKQNLMRAALERISKTPNLSKDVFEVVSRALAQ